MCALILSPLNEESHYVPLQNDNIDGNARAATRPRPFTAQTATRPPPPPRKLWRARHTRPAPTAADAPHANGRES